MTQAYLKRYLKLIPHRILNYIGKHIIPTLTVVGLILLTFVGLYFLSTPSQKDVFGVSVASEFPAPKLETPTVTAKHVFILDQGSGKVLLSKGADDEIYPASTTKIVTGLVALESFSLNDVITVTTEYKEGQRVGFLPGEKITVENLLYALLIESANDAAEIFAENYPGGRVAFVAAMNSYVSDLGLKHTQFKNPTGLDEEGHYSSASDLGRLASHAMKNPLFSRIVSTENTVISSIDENQRHIITNTNELLGKVPGVFGMKTGFTDLAGQSLVTLVNREGYVLVFVVMGSEDRFGETKQLIDWAYSGLAGEY